MMEQRCRRNLTEADKKVWIVVKITTLPLLELDFAGWELCRSLWELGGVCAGWVLGAGVDPDLPEFGAGWAQVIGAG